MARKFHVIEADGSSGPMLKKSSALLLVRRQLAILLAPFVIRRVPKNFAQSQPATRADYQHHLEPKFINMTLGNSPWLRHLHGYEEYEAG